MSTGERSLKVNVSAAAETGVDPNRAAIRMTTRNTHTYVADLFSIEFILSLLTDKRK
jgi:hypothetical protein